MKRPAVVGFVLLMAPWFWGTASGQDTFFDLGNIQKIEIFFSQPNWNHQLHILKITTEGYLKADSVKINGVNFPNVGVKYKGNSSYDSNQVKNPLHIALDKYQNQDYEGVNEIKVSNCFKDPSMIREVLSYKILNQYMESSRCNFAKIWVNGQQFGLYANTEDVGKGFCAKKFKSTKSNTFIKCNPIVTPAPGTKSNLKYLGGDSALYNNFYEIKSTSGWGQLVNLCETASNFPQNLAQTVDMDRFIWMLAFNIVLDNLDSYTGAFAQNYYLFKDNHGFFNPVVWDLNMSFGGFPFLGSSNNSLGSLSIANLKQLPLTVHQTDPYWPMINAIQANPRWKKMYHAHVKTIIDEVFANGLYETWANQLRATIDTAVASDPNKFYSYTQFQNSMTTDISVGAYQAPGIKNLMDARTSYLLSRPELATAGPEISNIQGSMNNQNGQATISAQLSNYLDTAIFLGYRENPTKKFSRIRMYDDGLHGDGQAGDQIFGASFQADAFQSQFYVYAENSAAATFSPARAEFDYYDLTSFTATNSIFAKYPEILAFPNPSNHQLWIETKEMKVVEIFDLAGKSVWKGQVDGKMELSVSNWNTGIYILRSGQNFQKLDIFH